MRIPVVDQELLHQHRRVAEANATFAAMYGRDNPEDLIGLQLDDIQNRGFKCSRSAPYHS
jgi:hypothetical protein